MKKIMILALASTAFLATMIGFSEKTAADDIEIPAVERNGNWVIPEFEAVNFSPWRESPRVLYNTETGEYKIDAPPWSAASPGTHRVTYALRGRSSGIVFLSGRRDNDTSPIRRSFLETGDLIGYTLVITTLDHVWPNQPRTATLHINSMRPAHQRVSIYEHNNGRGDNKDYHGTVNRANLPEWNDRISSIGILRGMKVTFYEDTNFRNGSRTIMNNSGQAMLVNLSDFGWDDRISSLRVAPITGDEFGVKLFEQSNQLGRSYQITEPRDNSSLRANGDFNDLTRSLELLPNSRIELFEDVLFGGRSAVFENPGSMVMNINLDETNSPWLAGRVSSYRVTRMN